MRDTFIGVLSEMAPVHPELLLLNGDLGFVFLTASSTSFLGST